MYLKFQDFAHSQQQNTPTPISEPSFGMDTPPISEMKPRTPPHHQQSRVLALLFPLPLLLDLLFLPLLRLLLESAPLLPLNCERVLAWAVFGRRRATLEPARAPGAVEGRARLEDAGLRSRRRKVAATAACSPLFEADSAASFTIGDMEDEETTCKLRACCS